MAPGDTARLYHALSSYSRDHWDLVRDWSIPRDHPLVRRDFVDNDRPTFPAHCKAYPADLPTVALPRSWAVRGRPTLEVLAGLAGARPATLDLERLSRLLHLSTGVVRIVERRDGRVFWFRSAKSAGGLFPLEVFVAARDVDGLPDGVHWYEPRSHELVQVGPPPGGEATTVVVTGIPWRTGWRYSERALRHLYWDVGTTLANTLALADYMDLGPRLRTVFPDAAVSRLVGADGVQEFPLAIVSFGDSEPAIVPSGDAVAGVIDRAPVEFPLITKAQHAGDGDRLGESVPPGPPLAAVPPPSADLDAIASRSSARTLDAAASVSGEVFRWSLAASLRGSRVTNFIAVHAVDGVEPGLYRWPDLDRPVRTGDLREELFRVCADQELGRDAAFVVIGAVDLDRIDDRGYREAQLDSGLVGGRLLLAAVALGIGGSGMTFFDGDLPGLLGEPLAGLMLACLGVPVRKGLPGGTPGEPIVLPSQRV
jgi:hypothetical protein